MEIIATFEMHIEIPDDENPRDSLRRSVERMEHIGELLRALRLIDIKQIQPWEKSARFDCL